jgi:hypothetical protein
MATATGSYATAAALKTRAGISDTADDTLIGTICDQVNQFIESETKRVLAPITSATYKFDGNGSNKLRVTHTSDGTAIGGIRAITALGIAATTGLSYDTIVSTDYFLRRKSLPAAPYDFLYLSDIPTSGYSAFPSGFDTVQITCTAGWAAIPDDITEVALTLATKLWHRRETGQADVVGTDEFGRITIPNILEPIEKATLRRYKLGSDLA